MASSEAPPSSSATTAPSLPASSPANAAHNPNAESTASTQPVEMSQLNASRPELDRFMTPPTSLPVSPMDGSFPSQHVDSALDTSAAPAAATLSSADASTALARSETGPAIGPAVDHEEEATTSVSIAASADPAVTITLLLTTGARHPFRIDNKYLSKRNISPQDDDPLNISVYTMKELIWRDWRDEWESRPTSPSSIRLITFGRLLDDKSTLRDCKLSTEQPNVVHMTVKPSDTGDDDGLAKGKGSRPGEDGASAGCKCCSVM